MNQPNLAPKNELDQQLSQLQQGALDEKQFMDQLFVSELFMPILDEEGSQVGNLQKSQNATPLTLEAEDGTHVLVLFTSPERARPFLQDFPGFGGGLLAEFKWILEKVGGGYAISINPDGDDGIDLEAGMIEQLAEANQ